MIRFAPVLLEHSNFISISWLSSPLLFISSPLLGSFQTPNHITPSTLTNLYYPPFFAMAHSFFLSPLYYPPFFAMAHSFFLSPQLSLSLSFPSSLFLFLFLLIAAYEVPFFCRLDAVNKLLDEKALTPAEVSFEIARLHGRDSCRLRGNDPFAMSNLPW